MDMEQATATAQPKIKHKTYSYQITLSWTENRAGSLQAEGKPSFRVASPPEFKGEAGVWSPEDLFVASVNICNMTTFMAFAQRLQLPVVSYVSNAEGVLEFVESGYRFTKIILRPVVAVKEADAIPQVEKTLHDAHKSCLIANSINSQVIVEPTIKVQQL